MIFNGKQNKKGFIIMIKKAMNARKGIKGTTQLHERQKKPKKHHRTIDSQERVNLCLTCTKPAKLCKGDCFGRNK